MSVPHLPAELLLVIFNNLVSRTELLLSVALVSRTFHALVEPLIYHTVTLSARYSLDTFIKALLRQSHRGEFVRSLTVDWYTFDGEEPEAHSSYHTFHSDAAPFHYGSMELEMETAGNHWTSGPSPIEAPIAAAEARKMSPGIRLAIRSEIPAAKLVLLLDMLPNLNTLVVYPSRIDYWFFGAFPSPTDEPKDKRIPVGLQSLRRLEIHYHESHESHPTRMNAGEGYAHIKIICALLLPNIQTLVLVNDDGYDNTWDAYYAEDANNKDESTFIDMSLLAGASSATEIELRGAFVPDDFLHSIMHMVPRLEKFRLEQYEGCDYSVLNEVVRSLSIKHLAFVEYDLEDDDDRSPAYLPFSHIGDLRTITQLELPIRALLSAGDKNFSRVVPVSVEHLDLSFSSSLQLNLFIPAILSFLREGHCPNLRHLTLRPKSRSDPFETWEDLLKACSVAKVELHEEHYRDPPYDDDDDFDEEEDFGDGYSDDEYYDDDPEYYFNHYDSEFEDYHDSGGDQEWSDSEASVSDESDDEDMPALELIP